MSNLGRLIWGLIGGLAVVCTKVIGPDQAIVKDMFLSNKSAELLFYGLISALTIVVAGIGATFSVENKPFKILIFAASFPALISTYISAPKPGQQEGTVATQNVAWLTSGLISVARAEEANNNDDLVCNEGSFSDRFGTAAKTYLLNQPPAASYAVIVASEDSFDTAKLKADILASKTTKYSVGVGCRKPGNPYFPVIVGGSTDDLALASTIKAELIAGGLAPSDAYLSNYPYRQIVYEARSH